jgi:hypothetical protein
MMMNSDQQKNELGPELEGSQQAERTDPAVRAVVLDLLKHGFIEEEEKPLVYRDARRCEDQLNKVLEPLELMMRVDDLRGLLILMVLESSDSVYKIDEAWSHPLIRRRRFTLEQSLVLALLRRHYLVSEQDRGVGMQSVKVHLEDLVNEVISFIGDSGSDQKNQRKVLELLKNLKDHGIVTEVDKHDELVVRPLIKYLADPENLKALLRQYQQTAEESKSETQ